MYRSSPFRSTLNTGYVTCLGMCKVCTEAVHSVALCPAKTAQTPKHGPSKKDRNRARGVFQGRRTSRSAGIYIYIYSAVFFICKFGSSCEPKKHCNCSNLSRTLLDAVNDEVLEGATWFDSNWPFVGSFLFPIVLTIPFLPFLKSAVDDALRSPYVLGWLTVPF